MSNLESRSNPALKQAVDQGFVSTELTDMTRASKSDLGVSDTDPSLKTCFQKRH